MTYPYGATALATGTGADSDPLNVYFHTKASGSWATVTVDTSVAKADSWWSLAVANNESTFLLALTAAGTEAVYQSLDSGATWEELETDLTLSTYGEIVAFYFLGTEWLLFSNDHSGAVHLHVSTDGLTWTDRDGPDLYADWPMMAAHIVADVNDRLHVLGAWPNLNYSYSDDFGVTWTESQVVLSEYPDHYAIVSSGSVVAVVGIYDYDTAHIYQAVSLDGGDTWSEEAYLNTGLFSYPGWTWGGDLYSYSALPLLLSGTTLYMLGTAYASVLGTLYYVAGMMSSTDWSAGLPSWSKTASVDTAEYQAWRAAFPAQDPSALSGEMVIGGLTKYYDPLLLPIDTRAFAEVSLASGGATSFYDLVGAGTSFGGAPPGGGEHAEIWHTAYFSFVRGGVVSNINVYFF